MYSSIGQLAQRRVRAGSLADHPRYELQYQVGLRELNGNSYLWVDEAKIKSESFPADVLGLERVENGPAFVRPKSLRKSDGKLIAAEEVAAAVPRLHAALRAHGASPCAPGSVLLSCRPADGGPPMHVVALYAPSGALGPRVKGLERQAMHARLRLAAA